MPPKPSTWPSRIFTVKNARTTMRSCPPRSTSSSSTSIQCRPKLASIHSAAMSAISSAPTAEKFSKTTSENPTPDKAKKLAAGFHTHVLSGSPEDTDVFHVLTQDPRMPEIVATPHFVFKILVDGAITVEKTRN